MLLTGMLGEAQGHMEQQICTERSLTFLLSSILLPPTRYMNNNLEQPKAEEQECEEKILACDVQSQTDVLTPRHKMKGAFPMLKGENSLHTSAFNMESARGQICLQSEQTQIKNC